MVEYKKKFLSEIKYIFFYFVEFSNNNLILPKVYPNNCVVGRSDKKLVNMITYNKNIFFVNNNY